MALPSSEVLVDVVIPTHGSPTHLGEAIESVLAQTFTSWRLTVSDNGPGDGDAAAVVGRYQGDGRVRNMPTGRVVPMHENWTRAIRAGNAPYVAMLHDDDRWEPGFLDRRVRFMEANPSCGLVFSAMHDVDEHGGKVAAIPHRLDEGLHPPADFVPRLFERMLIGSPTSLVRRRAYEGVGAAFSGDFINCDWEMWMRIALRHPVGYLAVRDCSRRLHGESNTSANRRGWGEEHLKLIDHFMVLAGRELPGLSWPRRTIARRRSAALLTCALDALEQGDGRAGASFVRSAVRTYPPSVLDPRLGGALVALGGGEAGRRALGRVRGQQERRRVKLHLEDLRNAVRDLRSRVRRG